MLECIRLDVQPEVLALIRRTSSDVNSARVGTRFSTATASTAVATGMPDLRIHWPPGDQVDCWLSSMVCMHNVMDGQHSCLPKKAV